MTPAYFTDLKQEKCTYRCRKVKFLIAAVQDVNSFSVSNPKSRQKKSLFNAIKKKKNNKKTQFSAL